MSDSAVQLLADRDAIHDVMVRYTHGVDRRENDVVRECFSPDIRTAAWHNLEEDLDREELVRFISCVDIFRETMHMMGNQLIEVNGDTACMDTFAMLTHRLDNEDEKLLGRRLYVEKLERRHGSWMIVERGGTPTWAPTGVTGVKTDDRAVQWLLDRAEIRDVLVQYTVALDEGDPTRAARYLADVNRGFEFDTGNRARHFIGVPLVTVSGDEASAETISFITAVVEGDQTVPPAITPVHSDYRLMREGGRWRLAERVVEASRLTPTVRVPPESDDPEVRPIRDRAMIEDAITASAFAVVNHDEQLLRECCADDVVMFARAGGKIERIDAVLDALGATSWNAHRLWLVLNNQVVDVQGDQATADTYVYAVQQDTALDDVSSWTEGARRFVDRLRRDGAQWRIVERRVEDNVMQDDRVVPRPHGDRGIDHELLTVRARARARNGL